MTEGIENPGKLNRKPVRAQVGGLHVFVDRPFKFGSKCAARHFALPFACRRACVAPVWPRLYASAALNRFLQAKLAVERHVRNARRASRVRALHLHVGIQRIHGGGGAWRGLVGSLYACRCFARCGRRAEAARPAEPCDCPGGGAELREGRTRRTTKRHARAGTSRPDALPKEFV